MNSRANFCANDADRIQSPIESGLSVPAGGDVYAANGLRFVLTHKKPCRCELSGAASGKRGFSFPFRILCRADKTSSQRRRMVQT
uniref:Uncharacterized protein n=1 Tax=Globodera rostochiensis TaxID=31243 RepID=A0A914H0J4_GLORO